MYGKPLSMMSLFSLKLVLMWTNIDWPRVSPWRAVLISNCVACKIYKWIGLTKLSHGFEVKYLAETLIIVAFAILSLSILICYGLLASSGDF